MFLFPWFFKKQAAKIAPPKIQQDKNIVYYTVNRFSGFTHKRTAKVKNFFAYSWINKNGGYLR